MGRVFVGNHGGSGQLYYCKKCNTYLTCQGLMTSPHFTGSTGPAMLFRKVYNIEHGTAENRKMTTGWHVVRDVTCITCKSRLGWMYEMARETGQMYKEGQVILENELITYQTSPADPLGADDIDEPKNIEGIYERPNRIRSNRSSESNSSRLRMLSISSDDDQQQKNTYKQ